MNLMSSFASWFSCCEGLTNSCNRHLKYLGVGLDVGVGLALVVLHRPTRYIRIEISFARTLTQPSLQWLCHRELTYKFIAEKSFQFNYLFKYNCLDWYSPPLFHRPWGELIIYVSVYVGQDVSPEAILQGKWNINIQNYNPIIDRMSKKEMTLVYYHVPEDKDDPECPNVFGVPYNKNTLKLTHIYESFPLKGTYLFRFKYACEGQVVWLDLPDVEAKLPTFKDKIYVKATRVSWNDSKLHSHYREKQSHVQLQTNSTQPHHIDFFENSSPPPKKEETKITTNIPNNRVDYVKEKPQTMPKIQSNLLEEVHPPQNGSSANNNNSLGMDFLGGMSSPVPSVQKKPEINLMHGFEKQNHGDLI